LAEKELAFNFDTGDVEEQKKPAPEQPKPEKKITPSEPAESKKPQKQTGEEKAPQQAGRMPYTGIKVFRYGATDIAEDIGINPNEEYTEEQLINRLQANGYYEFKSNNTNFAFNQERGILAVTIKGNSKG
jgi:hypothetical protein